MPTYRGRPCCDCQAAWLPAFEAEAQARGILTGPLPISQLIGGAVASGGTHAMGGAADWLSGNTDLVWLARQMGADATWRRPPNWDSRGGVEHTHSVLRGCPHNAPARYQIAAVDAGYNGLGKGGMGALDDGPRPLSGRTWQQGLAWQREKAAARAKRTRLTATIATLRERRAAIGARIKTLAAKRKAL